MPIDFSGIVVIIRDVIIGSGLSIGVVLFDIFFYFFVISLVKIYFHFKPSEWVKKYGANWIDVTPFHAVLFCVMGVLVLAEIIVFASIIGVTGEGSISFYIFLGAFAYVTQAIVVYIWNKLKWLSIFPRGQRHKIMFRGNYISCDLFFEILKIEWSHIHCLSVDVISYGRHAEDKDRVSKEQNLRFSYDQLNSPATFYITCVGEDGKKLTPCDMDVENK